MNLADTDTQIATSPTTALPVVAVPGVEAWHVESNVVPMIALSFTFEGGAAQDPEGKAGCAQMLARLDAAPPTPPRLGGEDDAVAQTTDTDLLPRPLRPYFGSSWRALRWRWTAPGVHMIRAARPTGDNLILLKIAPGKSMPVHSHGGSELTQIIKGAYDDALGHFGPGDMADLDGEVEHQPVTSPGVPCICVAALDAPLRFPGWLARKVQPLVGL